MNMDKERMRALHAIIDQNIYEDLLNPKEALRRVLEAAKKEFPELTDKEIIVSMEAQGEDLQIQGQDDMDQGMAIRRIGQLGRIAETRSGRKGLTIREALKYLADHGDEEAKAMDEQFSMPDYVAFVRDAEAAATADPYWHADEQRYWCDERAEQKTVFELVQEYRRRQGQGF